jgi:hypothetical protein
LRLRGMLSDETIVQLNQALLIALDLPGQAWTTPTRSLNK